MNKPPPRTERASAVALSYKAGMSAPTVVAKGYGALAERIVEQAHHAGVFVHDSPELVNLLMGVDLDEHIPVELYQAIAEVLAFIHHLEQQAGGPGSGAGAAAGAIKAQLAPTARNPAAPPKSVPRPQPKTATDSPPETPST
jgi:flagellar biosynthesis protein